MLVLVVAAGFLDREAVKGQVGIAFDELQSGHWNS